MKHLFEYRDPQLIKKLSKQIHSICTQPWKIMEICGGQTHSIVKHQLDQLLPPQIELVHGPGCPVCVTPQEIIDFAVYLALNKNIMIASFGDMLRVPGSSGQSLQEARAQGARIEIVYSPLDALTLAQQNPNLQIVFLAVGFETTSLPNAITLLRAKAEKIINFYLLTHQVRVPPALSAIMDNTETRVQGFLAAGHVCTVTGASEYTPICEKYHVPIVITGFEPVDVLSGLKQLIELLESNQTEVKIQYSRSVKEDGNKEGIKLLNSVFEISNQKWRGLGEIAQSGRIIREEFSQFDAIKKWKAEYQQVLNQFSRAIETECQSAKVLQGLLKPKACPQFGKSCTPQNPLGAPMVSTEGACAAYYAVSNEI